MAMKKFHGSFANALIEGLCFLLVGWGRDIVAAQGIRRRGWSYWRDWRVVRSWAGVVATRERARFLPRAKGVRVMSAS